MDYAIAGDSAVGLVRDHNEDASGVQRCEVGWLLVVADGMGGHAAGEVASSLAVHRLLATADRFAAGLAPAQVQALLARAAQDAHQEIRAGATGGQQGMGCTLTAICLTGDRAVGVHIGDSRLYLLRGGELSLLTDDHTLVVELVRQQVITRDQAIGHAGRNVLTRALGVGPAAELQRLSEPLLPGDRLLLCTDGLSGQVPPGQLARLLAADEHPAGIVAELLAAAHDAGAPDNVTAMVVLVEAGEAGDASSD